MIFFFQGISAQSVDDMIDDLGISKKGKMALNVKPMSSYSQAKAKLLKKKPENLFYDQVGNVFSVVFLSPDNYAEIKFEEDGDMVLACTVEGYLTSSAKIDELSKKITKLLNKRYLSQGDGAWAGSGMDIEFYDTADGFSLKFIFNQ